MKKILCLLLICTTLISLFTTVNVHAEYAYDEYKNDIRVLKDLNIIDETDECKPNDRIKKKVFMDAVLRLTKDNVEADDNSVNDADGYITQEAAVDYILEILGYKNILNINPEDSGAATVKSNILKDVKYAPQASISYLDAVRMIKNAVEEDIYVLTDINDGATFEKQNNILSVKRNIYKRMGRVTGNEYTRITSKEGTQNGEVEIDGVLYNTNFSNAESYLGKIITFYVHDDGKEMPSVITVEKEYEKQKSIVVAPDDIHSISPDLRNVEYIDENEKVHSIKLSKALKVIYNGVFLEHYTNDDFIFEDGNINFINNGNGNEYDIAVITSYHAMWVANKSKFDNRIYNKYRQDEYIEFSEDKKISVIKDGEVKSFGDICINDVLSVAASKDEEVINIIVCNDSFEGMIQSKKGDEIVINDVEYKLNVSYLDALKNNSSYANTAELGMEYVFYTDAKGEIVAMVKKNGYLFYALLFSLKLDDDTTEEKIKVTYLDEESVWNTAYLAQKVRINDAVIEDYDVYERLVGDVERPRTNPQIVLIKLNREGEIRELYTIDDTGRENAKLRATQEENLQWMRNQKRFSFQIYTTDNLPLFVMPETPSKDKNDYFVTKPDWLPVDYYYPIIGYNCDEFGLAEAISVRATADVYRLRGSRVVVEKIARGLNADDEETTVLSCSFGSFAGEYKLYASNKDVFKDIKVGDIVICSVDVTGYVVYAQKLYSLDNIGRFSSGGDGYFGGLIKDINFDKMMVRFECDRDVIMEFQSGTNTQLYDKKRKKLYSATVYDMRPGDELYANVSDGLLTQFIIIRKEV